MCWACYTPLSGAVTNSANQPGNMGMSPGEINTSENVKKAIPTWQLGVIGFGLLVVLFMGARTLMGGPPESDGEQYTAPAKSPDATTRSPNITPSTATTNITTALSSAPPVMPATAPGPGQQSFTVSVPPKAGVSWGTMAIVPVGSVAPQQAAALAALACQQTVSGGKWDGLYVYVFSDADSARQFREFQSPREGAPLEKSDYSQLRDLWPKAMVRYEYSRGFEAVRYPSMKPGAWWYGNSAYRRAQF